ncbi:MAG: hypothetical protein KDD70_14770, partial [Bdellovibrionales bacterium]|nr:hypothetical protein [Bdellovibrionales bacterium]
MTAQPEACTTAAPNKTDWVEELFRCSPLKKEKFAYLKAFLPSDLRGLHLIDIGGDNGVISSKLRDLGGQWSSVDLIEEAVGSIRAVVGERVYKMEGIAIPLPEKSFDFVLV